MLEGIINRLRPSSERRVLQEVAGINNVPAKELCTCIWTDTEGKSVKVDLLGTDKYERIALLCKKEVGKGAIWLAERDQAGAHGTWMWTQKQMESGQRRNKSIRARLNNEAIEVAPIHKDRRTEILTIGKYMGKTDQEIIERLRAEGFNEKLPDDYRGTWNPYEKTTDTLPSPNTEPEIPAIPPLDEKKNRTAE